MFFGHYLFYLCPSSGMGELRSVTNLYAARECPNRIIKKLIKFHKN